MSTLLIDTEKSKVKTDEQDNQLFFGETDAGFTRNDDPRPVLKPRNNFISVVDNFTWYAGKKASPSALDRIPKAFIVEREQLRSSLISGALYYLKAGKGSLQKAGQVVRGVDKESGGYLYTLMNPLDSAIDSLKKNITKNFLNVENFESGITAILGGDKLGSAGIDGGVDAQLLQNANLKSLLGIYLTQNTGFQYSFPYFESMPPVSNSWTKEGNTALQGFMDKGGGILESIAKVAFISQPGVYIQRPKYYEFEDTGKTVTINLPLFNTVNRGTQPEYQRNYELLWLLAFQNKTYKTSFSRSMPSKIYSVTIPGIAAFPYSYISEMVIEFNGTVRNREVSLPKLAHGKIIAQRMNVPIPDAYTVSITFQSLLADYANIMMSNNFMTHLVPTGAILGDAPAVTPTDPFEPETEPIAPSSPTSSPSAPAQESQGGFIDSVIDFFAPLPIDSRNQRGPGG
mgnify:CR=1 FL=1